VMSQMRPGVNSVTNEHENLLPAALLRAISAASKSWQAAHVR
jgi:hypothetical protein